jgi:HAD superfamily hydrolase (TIGR01509 family)
MPEPSGVAAILFDFDGTIIDSETAVFEAYRRLYEAHGHELSLQEWASGIGTLGGFDPVQELETRLGREIDEAVLQGRSWEDIAGAGDPGLRPGVRDYIDLARERGIALGIVSSNDRAWVDRHVERLGVADVWSTIATADGDEARAKPSAALYLQALEELRVEASAAVAIEDSPNGIAAARSAGVFCVAAPNDVTARLDLSAADVVVRSLDELPFERLLALVEAPGRDGLSGSRS